MQRIFPFLGFLFLLGCGSQGTPLDAGARRQVDSLSAAGIGVARRELDSICKESQTTVLPLLIDSLKKERKKEIQRQLETVPK